VSLPLLISVPHAGRQVPPEVKRINLLSVEQIIEDGDEGAHEVYAIQDEVMAFVTTNIARAYVDMNREEDDRGSDGVVKTKTIYQVPIYLHPLQEKHIHMLLTRYYLPYHRKLSRLANDIVLGIDCHTMAAEAPPISPDAGTERPLVCLSNADGTCPQDWFSLMADCLAETFRCNVALNEPFKGGSIIRSHASELPWMQLELSRAQFMDAKDKRSRVLSAFQRWCTEVEKK